MLAVAGITVSILELHRLVESFLALCFNQFGLIA